MILKKEKDRKIEKYFWEEKEVLLNMKKKALKIILGCTFIAKSLSLNQKYLI